MTDVEQLLARDGDAVPFSTYMAAALYGKGGYYQDHVHIGKAGGDFYTAAASPLFAATLANVIYEDWRQLGQPEVLQVVEFGAGEGQFARDLLVFLNERLPGEVRVVFAIVEVSEGLRRRQRAVLGSAAVQAEVDPSLATVVIANEVLDALPTDKLRRTPSGWEQGVVQRLPGGALTFGYQPATFDLATLADAWLPIAVNHEAELCLGYEDVIRQMAACGRAVVVHAFDYGITRDEWREGVRPRGTVRGYRQHQLVDVLSCPGQADVTADVYWDYVEWVAGQAGFAQTELVSQGTFLMRYGILDVLARLPAGDDARRQAAVHMLKQLVLPGGMGERFQVMTMRRE